MFMKDFLPLKPMDMSEKLTMKQVQDFVLDKAIYRDPFDSIRAIQKQMKEYPKE